MNKRITSILLCFVMMFSMLATAVPALAAPASTCTFTVEADKSEAHRGETITFTVYMQQTGKQNTLEFTVVPPEGLTYVAHSATLGENIQDTMGFDEVAWTEQSMYCSGFGAYSYEGTDKLTLLTFECTVDDDAAFKTYEFGLVDHWADDETYNTKNAVVVPATFSVVAVSPTTYTVTVSANEAAYGTAAGGGTYDENESVTVTATPNNGYQFVEWTENGQQVSTEASYTFTATAARSLVAVFEAIPPQQPTTYTVTVSANDAAYGTVTGGGTYNENASVTVTAAPEDGYQFVEWTENGQQASTDASYTFTATAARSLVAVFEAIPPQQPTTYTVTVSANDAAYGTVTGGGTYNENASVTVTAAPEDGYQFVEWTENGQQVSTEASYTFTATADHTLVAVFEAQRPTGHTHDYGQGTLPNNWDATHHWKKCTDQACPDPAGSIKDKAPHTDSDGDGHCDACDVNLIKISFAPGEGTGTMAAVYVTLLPGSVSYDFTLPANGFTAPSGKQFRVWSVGGVEKAVGDKITVAANTTVTAVWAGNTYNPRPNYPIYINPTPGSSSTGQIIAAKTFDGGIGLSVAVTILSAMGGAWLAKKKED